MEAIVDATITARSALVYQSVIEALSQDGYEPRIAKVPGKAKKSYRKCKAFGKAPVLSSVFNKNTKLMVIWWSRRISRWGFDAPHLLLYKGILPNAWLADVGLLGSSMLADVLPDRLEFSEESQCWAKNYAEILKKKNISKRKQPAAPPKKMPREFVFLPMQYSDDFSIKKHCSIPYTEFITRVSGFCASNKLPLVVKHHPDIVSNDRKMKWRTEELRKINRVLDKCRSIPGSKILVRDGSIHHFFRHCKFMAGMNTMAHVDAMLNECVSFHCGSSSFMNSGSVVHNNDIEAGMTKCLEMQFEEKQQLIRRQKAMIYYLYNRHAILIDDCFSSEWSNTRKIKNVLDYIKEAGQI